MVKISACVITKNEEKNIGRWLKNVKQIASEIIVVDTGSTDNTVKIAQEGGARIEHFTWINDFAAAKNYAIEKATGDWIIFLDADEYFSHQSISKVRECVEKYHSNRKIIGLACRLININVDNNNSFIDSMSQIRVFRNLRSLRYEGEIHEHLVSKASSVKDMRFVTEIEIYHTGYSSSLIQQKTERNAVFLEKQLAEEGESERLVVHLMDNYHARGKTEEALEYAKKAIKAKTRAVGMETEPYNVYISCLVKLNRPFEELLEVLHEAQQTFPDNEEFLLLEGIFLFREGDYLSTEELFDKAKKVEKEKAEKEISIECFSSNALKQWPKAYRCLSELSRLRSDMQGALDYLIKGLKIYPFDVELFSDLWQLLASFAPADIIEVLNSLYDKKSDAAFLATQLKKQKSGKVYLYYAKLAGIDDKLADYIAAERFDAAAAIAADRVEQLQHYSLWGARKINLPLEKSELPVLLPKALLEEEKKKRDEKNAEDSEKSVETEKISEASQKIETVSHKPLVSIMIPTYNRPELFEETLKSALSQTYENFEVIVCDNSTDERTATLIEKYKGDERLRYYRNREAKTKADNFRPFENLARGQFLQWCMDDDILLPQKLEKMIAVFEAHPEITLVTSQRSVINAKGELIELTHIDLGIKKEYEIFSGHDIGYTTLTSVLNFLGEPSAVLFRRKDLINHYWTAESRGYKTISDIAMWLELMEKGDCAIFRDALSCYRRHEAQEGAQPDVVLLSRIEWYNLMEDYYKQHIFLKSEEDRRTAFAKLYNEYKSTDIPDNFGSPEMRKQYEKCMEKIGTVLKEQK